MQNNLSRKRPEWHEYFMKITEDIAKRGTCISAEGGAIIVKDKRILSTGYIGAARKTKDCMQKGNCLRRQLKIPSGQQYEVCRSVHAEQNAVINAARDGVSIEGADMYLFMRRMYNGERVINALPCYICKKIIINAGIKNFYGIREDGTIKHYLVEDWAKELEEKDVHESKETHNSGDYNKN